MAEDKSELSELDKIVVNEMRRLTGMAENAFLARSAFLQKVFDVRRDLNEECGYKKTDQLSIAEYKELYDREGVARRLNDILPVECWKSAPTIYETEDQDEETEFERAWRELARSLEEEESHFDGEEGEGNKIWEYLRRVDILSGIGHYGVIFLGTNDGQDDLTQPLKPGSNLELLYVRVFDESLAAISRYDDNPTSKRFGKPDIYHLSFFNPFKSVEAVTSQEIQSKSVHYSRCLHIVDEIESSEVIGIPRLRPNYNRLMDIRKVAASSGEMYYRGAFPGLAFELHPQAMDATIDKEALRDAVERYMNTLQRYITAEGMVVKTLAPQVVDPSPQLNAYIEQICIERNVPKRIFMGTERGELASSQDKTAWDDLIDSRRRYRITPNIIVPFVNRLINLGMLPKPPRGFKVDWPDIRVMSDVEKADLANKITEALVNYIRGGVDSMIEPLDFLTRILYFSVDEATEILQNAIAAVKSADRIELGNPAPNPQEGQPGQGNGQQQAGSDNGTPTAEDRVNGNS